MTKLYRLEHPMGLGDAVALTVVLRHIRHYEPEARIELLVLPGREALYGAYLADEVTSTPDPDRPPTHLIQWDIPRRSYPGVPSTYAEKYLRDVLKMEPIDELCRYQVTPREEHIDAAADNLRRAGMIDVLHPHWPHKAAKRHKIVLFHHSGIAMAGKKNPTDKEAAAIARVFQHAGWHVLIWDHNRRSPLPDQHRLGARVPIEWIARPVAARPAVIEPGKTQPTHVLDAGLMAGLLYSVDLVVGVDSGPLHLATAVGTRSIGLWLDLSPVHCLAPAGCLTNVCLTRNTPNYEERVIEEPKADGVAYMRDHYNVVWSDDLADGVRQALEAAS